MSDNPLDKYRDTRTSASSSIAGCGWVEIQHNLCFVDDEGQILPASGAQYRLQVPYGALIYGVFDDNGFASHEGIGFGTVLLEVEPHIDDQKQLILKEIKRLLDEFLEAERKENEAITARLEGQSDLEADGEFFMSIGRGARTAAEQAFVLAADVFKEGLHILSYFNPITAPNSFERDVARVKQAKKELQAIADIDWGIYATLIKDNETQQVFRQFAYDYYDAQHGVEVIEGGSTGVFSVILGMMFLKAGSAVATGSGAEKLAQLGDNLADPIKRLIEVLKRAQAKAKVKGDGNQRIESKVDIEDNNHSGDFRNDALSPNTERALGSTSGHQYAGKILEGGSGKAFAGHGEYRIGSGDITIPQGAAVTLPREGINILDTTGRYIEAADWDGLAKAAAQNPRIADDINGMTTWLPGSKVPNYTLSAPTSPPLKIYQNSTTVETRTYLDDLLDQNMGCVDWAACTVITK